jgi:hypothetical protein
MDPGGHGRLAATSPCHGKHLACTRPSIEGTQRDEPVQVGSNPPCCSPFGDASGVRNPVRWSASEVLGMRGHRRCAAAIRASTACVLSKETVTVAPASR